MIAGVRPAIVVVVMLALGLVQITGWAFYGDLAVRPSVPATVPFTLGSLLARPLGSVRAPAFVRTAYARALFHHGDRAAAQSIVATLADNSDSADLRGQLLEAGGDVAGALTAYARAGDLERAQRLIDIASVAGRYADAAQRETVLVDALTGAGQAAIRARALWRLGQLRQQQAVVEPDHRLELERDSLERYESALAIAPNEETYLLAAGQQALTLGDRAAAERYYVRALEAVPDSVDARAGLDRARR